MKHQYEALGSTEQGEAIPLEQTAERPATPDTLVNDDQEAAQATTSTSTPIAINDSGVVKLPADLASVPEVRKCIVNILHGRYDVPLQEAESVAARWHGALGYRFRQMTHQDLKCLLGEQYADMIKDYRAAVKHHNDQKESQACCTVFLGVCAVVALVIILMIIT